MHEVSRAALTNKHACTVQIQPCPIKSTHPWERCCYAHPHENARRRDPRQYKYIAEPCPDYKRGICLLVNPATLLTATCVCMRFPNLHRRLGLWTFTSAEPHQACRILR